MKYDKNPSPGNPLKAGLEINLARMSTGFEVRGRIANTMTGLMIQCEESGGMFAVNLFESIEPLKEEPKPMPERMLSWFSYDHLPDHLKPTSKAFFKLAEEVVLTVRPGPERTVALRKLLEAKDAAVRAVVQPGG